MGVAMDERLIRGKIDALTELVATPLLELGPWKIRTAQHDGPETYRYDGDWEAAAVPREWPPLTTVFLR